MAIIRTRNPRDLSDDKYDEWFTGFVTWFLALPNTPEYCNWLRPGLQALDDDYFAKRIAAKHANNVQIDASAEWRDAVSALRLLLIKLRISLLSLVPGDDSVLKLFRIEKEVPEDPDDLVDYATLADLAWQPHAGEPEYAFYADRLNNIAPFCDDLKAKRIAMRQAITGYSNATDLKTAAREACHTRERAIFSFFRGEDLPSGFWTDSMWGLPSGGSGGGEEPQPSSWEDPVANLKVVEGAGRAASIRGDVHPDADGVAIFMAITPMGMAEAPPMPSKPYEPLVPSLPYDMPVEFNVRVWLWVCHVKGGAFGAMAGPVWIEIVK